MRTTRTQRLIDRDLFSADHRNGGNPLTPITRAESGDGLGVARGLIVGGLMSMVVWGVLVGLVLAL